MGKVSRKLLEISFYILENQSSIYCSYLTTCVTLVRYDTDRNGYVDHHEFLAKLGGEMAPGDVHGPSTQITEQSQQVMESMYRKQQVLVLINTIVT